MKKLINKLFLYFLLICILIVFLAPLYFVINTSLKSQSEFLTTPLAVVEEIKLINFYDAWKEASLGMYALNSIFYTFTCVVISQLMAIFLSFPIARRYFKHTNLIYTAFLAGMFLPSGIVPLWKMIYTVGLYNTRLGYMLTMIGGGGIAFFFFVSYIRNLPIEFDEAACMDGCGYIKYNFKILMPLMKPAIASMVVIQAIGVWNEVVNSIIFLSDEKLFPITRGLYVFQGQYSIEWPLLCASLIIVSVPSVILYIVLQKQIIGGIMAGGVKS